jgi:hypothetical protein
VNSSLVLAFVIGFAAQPPSSSISKQSDIRCGGYCLYVVLKALDRAPKSYAELEKLLGPPGNLGYSFAQLGDVAEGVGVKTLAVETSLGNLRNRTQPFTCIALLKASDASAGHFVIIQDCDDEKVSVIDPPNSFSVPVDTFRHIWTNKSLLLGHQPLQAEESVGKSWVPGWSILWSSLAGVAILLVLAVTRIRRRLNPSDVTGASALKLAIAVAIGTAGCGSNYSFRGRTGEKPRLSPATIQVTPAVHKIGDVVRREIDTSIEVTTLIRNVGAEPLTIYSIKPSCACTKVSLGQNVIEPNQSERLIAQIRLGDSAETQRASLVIQSSDQKNPFCEVSIEWRIVNPLQAFPEQVAWPALNPGEQATFSQSITLAEATQPDECTVTCTPSNPLLSCEMVRLGAKGEHATAHQAPESTPPSLGLLTTTIRAGSDPGTYHARTLLSVSRQKAEIARLLVPVSWTVRPSVRVSPSVISLGRRKSREHVSARVVLACEEKPVAILNVQCADQADIFRFSHLNGGSKQQTICMEVYLPDSPGPWRAIVRIETDHVQARVLTLPVSAILD